MVLEAEGTGAPGRRADRAPPLPVQVIFSLDPAFSVRYTDIYALAMGRGKHSESTDAMNTPANTIRETAAGMGLTRLVCMSAGANDRVLIINPDADLDEMFCAMCAETGELLTINGWLWSLEDDAETRARVAREFWDWREAPALGGGLKVNVSWHNPSSDTVWARLAQRLGREPTWAEANAEVKRILREARA